MKKLLLNFRLYVKLLIAPCVVMVFLFILGFVSYSGFSSQQSDMTEISEVRFKTYQDISIIINTVKDVHADVYKVISLASSGSSAEKVDALAKQQAVALEKAAGSIQALHNSPKLEQEEKKTIRSASDHLKGYRESVLKILDMASADFSMATAMMAPTDEKFRVLDKDFRAILELENRLSQERQASSASTFSRVRNIFISVLALSVILSLLVTFFMAGLIIKPIRRIIAVLKEVANGDLTRDVLVDSRDEIGELAETFNEMRLRMGDTVGQSAAISRLLSESAASQAASLEETSSSVEELASMTRQTAANTGEADQQAKGARAMMDKAQISMGSLVKSIEEISTSSADIQKIIKTIDEIAFQTNLLALNAAVEAARAGDAGAGFAVVADEVRNLALRAAESAKTTSELIEGTSKRIREGTDLIGQTEALYKEVAAATNKVEGLIAEIATASQSQAQGIEQVNLAITDIDKATQHNAGSAEKLASIMSIFRTECLQVSQKGVTE